MPRGCNEQVAPPVNPETAHLQTMKHLFFTACVMAPMLLACSKSDPDPSIATDPGCSGLAAMPASAHAITPAQVQLANSLFARNGLDTSRVRYVRFLQDSVATYYAPYAPLVTDNVGVEEYANGLPVFSQQVNYIFKAGTLSFTAGTPTRGTQRAGRPTLTAGQMRTRFFATVNEFDSSNNRLASQCVEARLGYYNLNSLTANTAENLVLAWKVNVKGQSYPFAYFEDTNGRLIYYDNGIRTFR